MTLPRRREKPRSGIERAPKREWPRHRAWVRTHSCCVPGCPVSPSEFAHVSSAANHGMALKAFDWFAVSLCRAHHEESHRGVETFMAKYRIDLWKLAAEFAARSPDIRMKAAMKEAAQAVLASYVAQGGPPNG